MPANEGTSSISEGSAKAIVVTLALLFGFGAWRWMHPSATLATDGTDASWDAAVEHIRETHRPALVLFTADWCCVCKSLHTQVLSQPEIEDEIRGHYTLIRVDLTQPTPADSERSSKFGVSGLPTLVRFDADGKETARVHYLPPARMLAWLQAGE